MSLSTMYEFALRLLQHSNAAVGLGKEAAAVTVDGRVPPNKLIHGNSILLGDEVAILVRLDEVEGLAACGHAALGRGRGHDAISRLGRGRIDSNHADADVGVELELGAVLAANLGVPLEELVESDAVRLGDGFAEISLLDFVECVAVVCGAIHVGGWRCDATLSTVSPIACLSRSGEEATPTFRA